MLGLSRARAKRRKAELEQLGAIVAVAVGKPKALGKVIRLSDPHEGRRRMGGKWWGTG